MHRKLAVFINMDALYALTYLVSVAPPWSGRGYMQG